MFLSFTTLSIIPVRAQEIKIKEVEENNFVYIDSKFNFNDYTFLSEKFQAVKNSLSTTLHQFKQEKGTVNKIDLQIAQTEWPKDLQNFEERYKINVEQNAISITAANIDGIIQGVSRLEHLLIKNNGKLQEGTYIDWPSMEFRGIHIPIAGVDSPKEIKSMLVDARRLGYNFVVFQLRGGVELNTLQGLTFEDLHPGAAFKIDPWTPTEFKDVVNFARGNGFLVIPELKLLTHQKQLLQDKYPDIMYNSLTYDPSNPKTYKIIFPIIDEIIALIHPEHFNIAHDEVIGIRRNHFKRGLIQLHEKVLPASLFVKDVKILYEYLSAKRIKVWMFGDMLLSPEEFPNMRGPLNALNDYKGIRQSIPKDIAIFDWHYKVKNKDFLTTTKLTKEGRFVIGVTWKRKKTIYNFANYVAKNNLPGMMAWLPGMKNEDFNFIFNESAKAFWNAQ